jgi:NAD(P)-dependent dehydrogenase (short-subunit alcohol dehydrogenase family)
MKLKDKVVVVTGSARGIGRAIAEECAREGAKVIICSRKEASVEETCLSLKNQGFDVSGIAADVSAWGDLERLLAHAVETWGKVDVWINNAGLSGGMRPLDEWSEDEISQIVQVNLIATLKACRLIIPYFIERGGGILINIGGKGGRCEASPFLTAYASTKAAVASLTKSLAREYKESPVSIHSVTPGMVATDFYKDMKTSPKLADNVQSIPFVLKAFGVPVSNVARFCVKIAAQEPGKLTGGNYSLLSRWRLVRGIWLMMYYRVTGKVKVRM